ncbi:MAG: hypothetical protein H5U40_06690, partial [Polyangiaceae bacterium]|nr:hypothetical protein [Polyangiaceae bacterium]
MRMPSAGSGLKSLIAKCQREAQRRGERPSTAHLLLVMLRSMDESGRLLAEHGVRESDLLGALRMVDAEAGGVLDRAVESSQRIAAELGESSAEGLHLLMAVTRDVRSGAHKGLASIGTSPQAVYGAARARLGMDVAATPPRAPEPPKATPRPLSPQPSLGRPARSRRVVDPRPRARRAREAEDAVALAAISHEPEISPARRPLETAASAPPRALSSFDLDAQRFPLLASIGRNLTAEAAAGAIDPV